MSRAPTGAISRHRAAASHERAGTGQALLDCLRRPLARLFDRVQAAERPTVVFDEARLARLGLKRRQAEVMQWVAAGKTDKEVAALMGLSPRTVHKHLQNIYAKLDVETRTAAVMRVLGSWPGS